MGETETLTYWDLKSATDAELQELKEIEARYASGEIRLGTAFEMTESLRNRVIEEGGGKS